MAKFEINSSQASKIVTALLTERREWAKFTSIPFADYKGVADRELAAIDECLAIFGYTALQLELPST